MFSYGLLHMDIPVSIDQLSWGSPQIDGWERERERERERVITWRFKYWYFQLKRKETFYSLYSFIGWLVSYFYILCPNSFSYWPESFDNFIPPPEKSSDYTFPASWIPLDSCMASHVVCKPSKEFGFAELLLSRSRPSLQCAQELPHFWCAQAIIFPA